MPKVHIDKINHYAYSQNEATKASNLLQWFDVMTETMTNYL
jgi:hypothetical protein